MEDLGCVMLSQTEKDKYHDFTYMWNLNKQMRQAGAVNRQLGGGSGTWGIGRFAGQPRPFGGSLLCAASPKVENTRLLYPPGGQLRNLCPGLEARGRGVGGEPAAGLQL